VRQDWDALPERVQEVVVGHTGAIARVVPAAAGNHAEIASTVEGARGVVFVKAARKVSRDQDGAEVRSLRWEAAISPHVSEFAPRLLDTVEAGGWLALVFEHVDGRCADYSPGSSDLEIVPKTIAALQRTPCPDVLKKRVERRWASVAADVSPMAGDTLLHGDLSPGNLLITDTRVYVIDWAFVARGAAWVEPALLMPWLIQAGHTPAEAEKWLTRVPSWANATPTHLDLFANAFATKWALNLKTNSAPWALKLAASARTWATHRRTSRNPIPKAITT
jgi:Phosphotransferase enzyme family